MSRYQRVSETPAGAGAEGAGAAVPPPSPPLAEVPLEPPPPYEPAEATGGAPLPPPPPPPPPPPAADKAVRFDLPPAYDAATNPAKLPSYDEVQQEKAREGGPPPPAETLSDDEERASALHLWRISVGMDPEAATALHDQQLLGTDLMFFTAFLAAFLFNWIGFLLLLCFCHSVAGRYGALAGFGLSLAKWTLIVKNSTTLVSHDNSWLWWLIMAFGLVISVRAILQYLYIKREWRQLPTSARQRLIFFY